MGEKPNEAARRAIGEIAGEFVLYDTWNPEREDLPEIHFAYVPLVPNVMQEIDAKVRGQTRGEASRISVITLAKQVRAWTLTNLKGEPIDCRDAKAIGAQAENVAVEGIMGRILDSRSTLAAREQIENFLKR
jgi:hypothetical protein